MELTIFNCTCSVKHVFLYVLYVSFVLTLVSVGNIFQGEQGTIEEVISPKKRYGGRKGTKGEMSPPLRFDIRHPVRGTRIRILHNAVPKTGSRTLDLLMRRLSSTDNCSVKCSAFPTIPILITRHAHGAGTTYVFLQEIADNPEKIRNFVDSLEAGSYVRGHFPILTINNSEIPLGYINLIRSPIERLMSNYYYDLYGDGGLHPNKSEKHSPTLDECLENELCYKGVYSYYKQSTLRTFCGHNTRCRKYSRWTLNTAKENSRRYIFIGLTDQMKESVEMLQLLLPDLFGGLSKVMQNGTQDASSSSRFKTVKKLPLSDKTLRFLQRDMSLEHEFYQFVSEGFEVAKRALLRNSTISL